MQDTEIRHGDSVTAAYYGNGQVHISLDRDKTPIYFKIEPDEGLDQELRGALRKSAYRILGWPVADSRAAKVFETKKLLEALFPGYVIVGNLLPGHTDPIATFVITGVEHRTQAA